MQPRVSSIINKDRQSPSPVRWIKSTLVAVANACYVDAELWAKLGTHVRSLVLRAHAAPKMLGQTFTRALVDPSDSGSLHRAEVSHVAATPDYYSQLMARHTSPAP